MPELQIIETLVILFGVGAIIAFLFQRVRLPSVLAFIVTGAVGFAVGFEYREEDGFFQPDPVVVAGETAAAVT
mgnify:CR=1 FL=1